MAYVADFVTGRAMAEREKAVGVVIVPRRGGWPDPVKAAAIDPVHAHDRFSPLSLPLKGVINDDGYFEPQKGQIGLRFLLDFTGYPDWKTFFKDSYTQKSEGDGFKIDGERVVAGIAAMRPETYKSLLALGGRGIKNDSAAAAARIFLDAQHRAFVNKEMTAYNVATLVGAPRGTWRTLGGEEIEAPHCALGLADGYPWEFQIDVREYFRNWGSKALERGEDGQSQFVELFEGLAEFQKLSRGLSDVGKYFTPGGFMRHENISAVMGLQVATLGAAVRGIAGRDYFGVEYREEKFLLEMEALSDKIAKIQNDLQKEIDTARRFLAGDEPEDVAPGLGMR